MGFSVRMNSHLQEHSSSRTRREAARVVGRADGWQKGQVDADQFAGHGLTATNLTSQIGRRALGQAGDDAEAAGIRDRRSHFRVADEMHAALDDGVFDAEHVGDSGFHGVEIFAWIEGSRRRGVGPGILSDRAAEENSSARDLGATRATTIASPGFRHSIVGQTLV